MTGVNAMIVDAESRYDDEQDESAFGNAKPMLPYSSMFILGSTNPSVYNWQSHTDSLF